MNSYCRKMVSVTAISLCAGCVSFPSPPSSSINIDQIQAKALKGRVVVIDPGHGGRYQGARGKMGLKESEVNLGVALYLWGLLRSAGAHPVLTRTADTTVAPPAHRSLSDDLNARSALSNQVMPDLFISIHHNSDIHHPRKNTLEMYYKLSDPGPSRDIAECIMKRLKETLSVNQTRVLPGNYSVLRNTQATAILGEASYLTHRQNEKRLTLHGFLRLEAEGYFLGILDYFQKGVPRILDLIPYQEVLPHAFPEVVGWVSDEQGGRGIDPTSIALYLDGEQVKHRYDPLRAEVRYVPTIPLANGIHLLQLEARNLGGNSARPLYSFFYISCPPCQVRLHPVHEVLPADGHSRTRIVAEVTDQHGSPVGDGTLVRFSTTGGELVNTLVPIQGGKAITHLISGYQEGEEAEVVVSCEGVWGSTSVLFAALKEGRVELYVCDKQGAPLEGAEVFFEDSSHQVTDRQGYVFYRGKKYGGMGWEVWKPGYLPVRSFTHLKQGQVVQERVMLEPFDQGLFWNKVVVIDPRGLEELSPACSTDEMRRGERTLRTARCLEEMLTLAGAKAVLTREGEEIITFPERVEKANNLKATLFLSLDHHSDFSSVGYYYNSPKGKKLACALAKVLRDELSCTKLELGESSDFVLVHTSMPAVTLALSDRKCKRLPHDGGERSWRAAQVLYQGIRSYFKEQSKP